MGKIKPKHTRLKKLYIRLNKYKNNPKITKTIEAQIKALETSKKNN